MGMDVYGKAPTSEAGKHFRNNVWWWRPLWDYCCEIAPALTAGVNGRDNDGDGLDAADSLRLADALDEQLRSGATERYAVQYTHMIEALPDEPCRMCAGTGRRLQPPAVGAGDLACNGCRTTGRVAAPGSMYLFSADNVRQFVAFLRDCGGFMIC